MQNSLAVISARVGTRKLAINRERSDVSKHRALRVFAARETLLIIRRVYERYAHSIRGYISQILRSVL